MRNILADHQKTPSEAATRAWVNLVRAQAELLAAVELALKKSGHPPLAWYDVLLELSRAENGRLRPYELEHRTLLTQYNLSRLLDRLEGAGLVAKEPFGDDGRGRIIALTEKGRETRVAMWEVYGDALAFLVGDRLSDEEAEQLSGLLAKLRSST